MFTALVPALLLTQLAAAEARPPEWLEGPSRELVLRAGEKVRVELRAVDPLGRELKYAAKALPAAATLTPPAGKFGAAILEWTPGDGDVGAHELEVSASSADATSTQKLHVVVERTWQRYLVPGAAFTLLLPNDDAKWGTFYGAAIELGLYSWIRENQSPGPGQGKVYLSFDVLASSKSSVSTQLEVSAGLQLSIERSPARSWLLPHFGLELGARFGKQLVSTLPVVTPSVGVALWSSPALSVDLLAGYALPLSGAELDELRGLRGRLGVTVPLW